MTPSRPNSTRCPHGKAFTIFCDLLAQETDECIPWPYSKHNDGYGVVGLGGKYRELTHRLAWVMTHRERIDFVRIDPQCDTPTCFNPRHLKKEQKPPKQPKFTRAGRPLCPKGTGATQLLVLSNADTDACVLWPYSVNPEGYGFVLYNGRVRRTRRAAWLLNRGEIGNDLKVCHTCDNPPCVNIRHLFLGTDRDNCDDKIRKGREWHGTGTKNGMAILTEDQVRKIRSTYRRGVRGCGAHVLARQYGVHTTTVKLILKGKSWRHLL